MILKNGEEWEAEDKDIIQWQRAYPAVDVFGELAKMESWCDANPARRKTKAGIKSFVNRWLGKAQEKGSSIPTKNDSPKTIRQRSNLDDLTDISWLDEGGFKEHMRRVFTNKYGQAFDG